jgi:hypothetical protein
MSERSKPIEPVHLTELIRNPVIVRMVSILDLASVSILELLEYNVDRKEINYALSEGVIAIDETTSTSSSELHTTKMIQEDNILLKEDSYFNFLNSKVKLTELGLYVLDSIKV